MVRLLGAVLIAGAGAWIGFHAESRLRSRVRALGEMAVGLSLLEQELELDGPPLPQLMERLERRTAGSARKLFGGCRQGLERLEQEEFSALWHRLVADAAELGQEGQDCLYPLSHTLGHCDTREQCRTVAVVRSRLEELRGRAEVECRRQGKVYRVLGLSGGVFLVILLI
jgi:stage III sporulation protein AB